MDHDELPRTEPRERSETNRDKALARYGAHPGIAIMLLSVMAFLFIVVAICLLPIASTTRPYRRVMLRPPQPKMP